MDSSLNLITKFVPDVTVTLPFVGVVYLTPVLAAILVLVVLNVAFWVLQKVVILQLKSWSERTTTDLDDTVIRAISGVRPWVYTLVSLYAALSLFNLSESFWKFATAVVLFTLVWQIIQAAGHFVGYFVSNFLERDDDGDGEVDPGSAMASDMVILISKIVMWVFGVIFVLSNLGIEVTSLIAGLGIGGIAVAFALQGILSDLFSSFSLYFDKPFRIGDYIVIGQHSGTVERVGIKTTRIRTLQGEELVVSNAELTATRVQNFKKLKERRISFRFGVTYETPHSKVKEINGIVERIINSIERGRLDRVHFLSFGDSALMFEVVYYVESDDYTDYLDIQQDINHQMMGMFAEIGIEFAYPTQMIYTKKLD